MRTYPIYTQEEDRLFAFEVENIYISPSMVANLLSQAHGVQRLKSARYLQSQAISMWSLIILDTPILFLNSMVTVVDIGLALEI